MHLQLAVHQVLQLNSARPQSLKITKNNLWNRQQNRPPIRRKSPSSRRRCSMKRTPIRNLLKEGEESSSPTEARFNCSTWIVNPTCAPRKHAQILKKPATRWSWSISQIRQSTLKSFPVTNTDKRERRSSTEIKSFSSTWKSIYTCMSQKPKSPLRNQFHFR
jgi:hypothetical protein